MGQLIYSALCLCQGTGISYPVQLSKQIGKLFFLKSARVYSFPGQTEERRHFWSIQTQIYPLNYLLYKGVMLTIIKVFTILFLLCLLEQGKPRQFSKEISKLSFQLSVQVCSLLGQSEGERQAFFGGCKKGKPHREIISKCTWLS